MTDAPATPYQSLISPRSRRLRTTGLVLLVAILGMTLYGYFVLMPSLRVPTPASTTVESRRMPSSSASVNSNAAMNRESKADAVARMSRQERDAQAAKLIFAYGFWGTCLALVIALMLVAWLDFREVSRNYDRQQAAIFAASLKNEANPE